MNAYFSHPLLNQSPKNVLSSSRFLVSSDRLYMLEEGVLDLFALAVEDQQEENLRHLVQHFVCFTHQDLPGQLHFLGTLQAGEWAFPFPLLQRESPYCVVAIARGDCLVSCLPLDQLQQALPDSEELQHFVMQQITRWIRVLQLSQEPVLPSSREVVTLSPHESTELKVGTILRGPLLSEQLNWLRVRQGEIDLWGFLNLHTEFSFLLYPCQSSLWFECRQPAVVEILPTEVKLSLSPELWKGVSAYQADLLKLLFFNQNSQLMQEREKTEQQEHFQYFLLNQSLFQLQTLLVPHAHPTASPRQDALYEACQLVGHRLGLVFRWSLAKHVYTSFEEHLHQLCLQSNIYYRKVKLTEDWWNTLDFPFVGFYEKDRPVALIPHFTKGYTLIEPLTQQTKKVDQNSANQLLKEGYLFYRSLPEHKLTIRNLWTFSIWQRGREWLLFLFLSLCGLLVSVSFPVITSFLFDHVIPNRNGELLVEMILGMLLIISTTLIFNYNRESLLLRLIGLVDQDLELAIWQRLMNLPVSFFRKYSLYDLYLFTTAISSIRQLLTSQVIQVFLNSCLSLVFIGLMFYYSQTLAIVGLAILVIELCVILFFLPFIMRYGRQLIDSQIVSNNKTFEIIQGLSKIRLAAAEIPFFHRWEEAFAHMKRMDLKMLLLKMKMGVFNIFWSNVSLSVLYIFIIFLLASQQTSYVFASTTLSLGHFMAFMAAFSFLSSSFQQLIKTILRVSLVAPLWEKVREFSKAEPEEFLTKADPGLLKGEIRVDNLSFSYGLTMPPVVHDVSFVIPAGKCAAFVGPSGCGKSTLIRLLLGFETSQQGAIYYDHKDIKGLNLQILRSQLGIALQSGAILDGTILDNINSGRHYTEQQAMEAMQLAGMTTFIQELPMGIQTVLTNSGGSLSGGQRQMILLARALVGKPKILMLDEATSSLDNQKQHEIHAQLARLPFTRLVITQRIETLREGVDRIYVMDNGRIVAQGTFEELVKQSDLFLQLLLKEDT